MPKKERELNRTCDKCKRQCDLFHSPSNPPASEWYCVNCHKSYYVGEKPKVSEVLSS